MAVHNVIYTELKCNKTYKWLSLKWVERHDCDKQQQQQQQQQQQHNNNNNDRNSLMI